MIREISLPNTNETHMKRCAVHRFSPRSLNSWATSSLVVRRVALVAGLTLFCVDLDCSFADIVAGIARRTGYTLFTAGVDDPASSAL